MKSKLLSEKKLSAVIGFDGFVDEVVHVVDKRIDADNYTRVETLAEYGTRIAKASGLSFNVEIFPVAKKLGGNGPIFALGLKKFGMGITYIGATGLANTNSVFADLAQGSTVIGVTDPAQTDAMEFLDGKIIRSKLSTLNSLTWEKIVSKRSAGELAELFDGADLLSFNNWTMITHMSDIWSHLLEEVFPLMRSRDKTVFFDLADPEKRKPQDILHALSLIQQFEKSGFCVVLGLNKKEACEIYELMTHDKILDYVTFDLEKVCVKVYDQLGIRCLVVHPTDRAACVVGGEYFEVQGPYCKNPVLTTGAGDNFNAGFVLGYMSHLTPTECLELGNFSSGYYVRFARSADVSELLSFMEDFKQGKIQ